MVSTEEHLTVLEFIVGFLKLFLYYIMFCFVCIGAMYNIQELENITVLP